MHSVDALMRIFNCNMCNRQLDDPIMLPCAESICRRDLTGLTDSGGHFICILCGEEHDEPISGFPVDKRIKAMIELGLNEVDFRKKHPRFNQCERDLNAINDKVNEIILIENDPQNFVYNFFEAVVNQVDLQREKLKEIADSYSENMIQTIKNIRNEFQMEQVLINPDFEVLRQELAQMNREFDSLQISDCQIEHLIERAARLRPKLLDRFKELENTIFADKTYLFKPSKLCAEEVFGVFKEVIVSFINYVETDLQRHLLIDIFTVRLDDSKRKHLQRKSSKLVRNFVGNQMATHLQRYKGWIRESHIS